MRKTLAWCVLALVALSVPAPLFAATVGTITGSRAGWTVSSITANGDTPWQYMEGLYNCQIYGTFDSASVDMEFRVPYTSDVKDVSVSALLTVTSATATAVLMESGGTEYRFEVASGGGSMDLTASCMRVRR